MKLRWKISLCGLIALVAACLLLFLFVRPAGSLSPSLLVRSVRSPVYSDQGAGSALLTLTNGSDQDVFFQIGQHNNPDLGLLWFGVERKRGEEWVVESQATEWTPKDVIVATRANHWPPGNALDFRVTLPPDGQLRRIVVRWKPTPRKVPTPLRRIQNLWWQKVALKRSSFVELRSSEVVVAPGAPRFDFQAATKRLNPKDIQPSRIEGSNTFLDGLGMKYSIDRKPNKTVP